MTVKEYLKNFKSIWGGLTAAIGSLPLVSLLPVEKLSSLFPPLNAIFRIVAVALVALTLIIVFFVQYREFFTSKRKRFRAIIATGIVAVFGAIAFLTAYELFVRTIDIPATDATVTVSVGLERTAFGQQGELAGLDDWQVLKEHGFTEEDIRKVWTARSLLVARVLLFSSYCCFILSSVATAALATLYDGYGVPPNP